jgi:DNA-binding MarR family transcriptional regulator
MDKLEKSHTLGIRLSIISFKALIPSFRTDLGGTRNWIHVPHKEIAGTLHMRASNVSRAIKLLEQKGILLRSAKDRRLYGYRLNPYYGWKSKVRHLELVKSS